MSETIFVGHEPGTYKIYYTIGGWAIMFLGEDGDTRYADGHHIFPHRQNAYRRCKQLNDQLQEKLQREQRHKALTATLETFLASPDFREGVISSTKASWEGSNYQVELFVDGTWQVLWERIIGNLYESPGVVLILPPLEIDAEEKTEYEESGGGSEDDYLKSAFYCEEQELQVSLRDELVRHVK